MGAAAARWLEVVGPGALALLFALDLLAVGLAIVTKRHALCDEAEFKGRLLPLRMRWGSSPERQEPSSTDSTAESPDTSADVPHIDQRETERWRREKTKPIPRS